MVHNLCGTSENITVEIGKLEVWRKFEMFELFSLATNGWIDRQQPCDDDVNGAAYINISTECIEFDEK